MLEFELFDERNKPSKEKTKNLLREKLCTNCDHFLKCLELRKISELLTCKYYTDTLNCYICMHSEPNAKTKYSLYCTLKMRSVSSDEALSCANFKDGELI